MLRPDRDFAPPLVPTGRRPNVSIGARFAAGATSGFDYLRLSLSLIVIFWHSNGIVGGAYGGGERSPGLQLFARIAVPLFFTLSGFLVSSSLERLNDVPRFLVNRFLRVLPALTCVVVLSALVLGPIFTTLSLRDYLTSAGFARYFLNLLGSAQYYLPGVFAAHEPSEVNRSLWTIPLELQCYLLLGGVYLAGGFRRTGFLVAALVVLTAVCAWVYRDYSYAAAPTVPGRLVMLYFLAGTIVYRLRDRLPGGPTIAAATLVVAWAMLADIRTTFASPLVLAYAMAAIGCTAPRKLPIVFDGDYSYGLYLYGMPVQQTLMALFGPMPLWVHFPLSVVATGACAAVSWHWIERPALALKSRFHRRGVERPTQATRIAAVPRRRTGSAGLEPPPRRPELLRAQVDLC